MSNDDLKVRMDKWLWAVRVYKTRSSATDACKSGKIKCRGISMKPSHIVQLGEFYQISKNGFNLTFEVSGLLDKRVGAKEVIYYYKDHTPPEEYTKKRDILELAPPVRARGSGRPTKKERREMNQLWEGNY